MSATVATRAIQAAVKGRGLEILAALGVTVNGARHVSCPYPDHDDRNPSWRWDARKGRAFCTCIDGGSDSVFDVVMKVRGIDFEGAKLFAAEALGRRDLIRETDGERHHATDAASLLHPPAGERDDELPRAYLAHRLQVEPDAVPMPSTPAAGWRALAYFDPPSNGTRKPELVGAFPCAVFGTVGADGQRHAQRIYVAPGGAGKADLGARPDGQRRDPKKSARVAEGDNTSGRAVLWGDPRKAARLILAEGIETAAAVALTFKAEVDAGAVAVAAATSATGVEAFQPYPATERVTVAADRDEDPAKEGRAGYRRGERAARAFGLAHHEQLEVSIALPGDPGTRADWLDVLLAHGGEAVRRGIEDAEPFVPTSEEAERAGGRARAPEPAAEKPVIQVQAGALGDVTRAAIDALKRAGVGIYDRGGALYRPVTVAADDPPGGIRRKRGAVVLHPVVPEWIELRLAEAAAWEKFDRRSEEWRRIDPPPKIAHLIVKAPDEGRWPYLAGVVQHPVLLPDGRMLDRPGYDPETKLLVDLGGAEWPAVPPNPTKNDGIAARERLEELLQHFPWAADEGDEEVARKNRAVALSLLLTSIARPVLPTAPLHAVDAPEAGTGKSLLVDAAALLAAGTRAPVMEHSASAEENTKRLDAMLLAGDSFIAIDNIDHPLGGATLCQTLTQERRKVRILGSSAEPTVACRALITATGNNLVLKGDITRRALVCRLDAKTEQPELRRIDQDLLAEVAKRRGELVRDCQTIMWAYIRAGRPDVELTALGSFDAWNRMVRAALVWAEAGDPVATMDETRKADPSRLAVQAVLSAWHDAYQDEAVTAATAIARTEHDPALREAIGQVALARGQLDTGKLGRWFRSHKDARAGGLVVRAGGMTRTGIQTWSVVKEGAGDAGDAGDVSTQRAKIGSLERLRKTNSIKGQEVSPAIPCIPCMDDPDAEDRAAIQDIDGAAEASAPPPDWEEVEL